MPEATDYLCPRHDPDASMAGTMMYGSRTSTHCPVCRGEEDAPTVGMMDWVLDPEARAKIMPPALSPEVLEILRSGRVFRPLEPIPLGELADLASQIFPKTGPKSCTPGAMVYGTRVIIDTECSLDDDAVRATGELIRRMAQAQERAADECVYQLFQAGLPDEAAPRCPGVDAGDACDRPLRTGRGTGAGKARADGPGTKLDRPTPRSVVNPAAGQQPRQDTCCHAGA
jgi:hypothetical protein